MVSLSNHLSGKSEYNGAPLMSFDTLRMSGAGEIQGVSNCNWNVYGLLPPYRSTRQAPQEWLGQATLSVTALLRITTYAHNVILNAVKNPKRSIETHIPHLDSCLISIATSGDSPAFAGAGFRRCAPQNDIRLSTASNHPRAQVYPVRVRRFYQGDLPVTLPSLDLLLAGNC